ncbi:hypothetical protein CI109_100798 [Kwoniella shandongensis]|uniref:Elongator complex protein 4 n=1 Tax=Kwoniella shandongensis TaxID=1734106 RepID=A0A5M6BV54_9TREE|nr:uncharacterized protein CI109_005023 [Kwoniella shandongensis]KAA5526633.1 hypothetical protein CI109_005023 [Kwoniella shandongensis]
MPSFTRRVPSTTLAPPPGTHPSPSLSTLPLLPTGLPSLDDLLGGGLPLGSTFLVLAPDNHSAWSRLISRYWISQGLISGQGSIVVSDQGREVVEGCMWVEKGASGTGDGSESEAEGGEGGPGGMGEEEGRRIAWRYEKMGKYKTTVGGNGSQLSLTTTIPPSVLSSIHTSGQQSYIPLDSSESEAESSSSSSSRRSNKFDTALKGIYEKLANADQRRATRLTIPELGGLDWGDDVEIEEIHRFLHGLRGIIRTKSASAIITVPPSLIAGPKGEEIVKRLAWCVDGCIELRGFADDPTLPPLFPTTHGLLTLHSYPTSHTLLPSTLKHSTLLGLSQSERQGSGGGGAGENNLGFKLKRKRFVVETVHLGVEGGVGERRTEPVSTGEVNNALSGTHSLPPAQPSVGMEVEGVERVGEVINAPVEVGMNRPRGPQGEKKPSKPRARVRFGGEEELGSVSNVVGERPTQHDHHGHDHDHAHGTSGGANGLPPRVALRHDRPDLYDF